MRWMIRATVPREQREAIAPLIPAEVARSLELKEQGLLEASYRAADQSYTWLVLRGESEVVLQDALESLPLYPFFELERKPLLEPAQVGRAEANAVSASAER
jgi:muconolactone delta-isomerase